MVAINNRVTGNVEEHGERPALPTPEESHSARVAYIRGGGGHASYGPDDNPHGRTPGDDGWNSGQTPAQKAFTQSLIEKERGRR